MDTLSNLNDIPSFWVVLPIILLSGLLLAYLFRGDPAVQLRSAGLTNRGYGLCLLAAALLTAITFRFLDPRVLPWGGGDQYFSRAINIVEYGVYGTGNTLRRSSRPDTALSLFRLCSCSADRPGRSLSQISCSSQGCLSLYGMY